MFEQVKQVLVDAIHVDEEAININANLKDDLNIDSLAAVELALELETEFDIRIEDEELAKKQEEERLRNEKEQEELIKKKKEQSMQQKKEHARKISEQTGIILD